MKRSREGEHEELKRFELFCSQFLYNSENNGTTRHPQNTTGNTNEESPKQDHSNDPFVAPFPNRYREKYSTPCSACFTNWYPFE